MTTAIAQTASITLLTGLPGSGKTLRLVKFCKEAHDKGEVVFVCNLNGLKLPHVPFEDPRQWRDIPAGSILVVDEAQQFFRARRGGDAPEYLTAMETIRHQGVRLVIATQQPDYLDTHLRGLVGLHEHLVRVNGKPAAKIWRHNEVMDNVRSERARGRYDSETWAYEPDLFPLYESAQVHTVKSVMSARMKRGLLLAGACALCVSFVGYKFFGFFQGAAQAGEGAPAPSAGREAGAPVPVRAAAESALEKHQPGAVDEYLANLTPRVETLPFSAPIFDGRKAVSEPRVFCMESGAGRDAQGEWRPGSVTCTTEQGTRVVMDERRARMLARQGEPYNPFRRPDGPQRADQRERAAGRDSGASGPSPVAVAVAADQVTPYGGIAEGGSP